MPQILSSLHGCQRMLSLSISSGSFVYSIKPQGREERGNDARQMDGGMLRVFYGTGGKREEK